MKKKWIAGNWKMNGSRSLAVSLVEASRKAAGEGAGVILCCPHTLLMHVEGLIRGSGIFLGAQDCHMYTCGAHTGDTSAPMLVEAGCSHVILGHSERRENHKETDAIVKAKCEAALANGLKVILCIGETLEQREKGNAYEVVTAQLNGSIPRQANSDNLLLAYEPIWAIGTGKVPSNEDIQQMHAHIRKEMDGFTVLYGGSVKSSNAAEILGIQGVGGVLVGGASLEAEAFGAIIRAAA